MVEPHAWMVGTQAWSVEPHAWMVGPQAWMVEPQAWMVGPQPWMVKPQTCMVGPPVRGTNNSTGLCPLLWLLHCFSCNS